MSRDEFVRNLLYKYKNELAKFNNDVVINNIKNNIPIGDEILEHYDNIDTIKSNYDKHVLKYKQMLYCYDSMYLRFCKKYNDIMLKSYVNAIKIKINNLQYYNFLVNIYPWLNVDVLFDKDKNIPCKYTFECLNV